MEDFSIEKFNSVLEGLKLIKIEPIKIEPIKVKIPNHKTVLK